MNETQSLFVLILNFFERSGEWYLGWEKTEIQGVSWYQLLHWECMKEAQSKHRLSEFLFDNFLIDRC